MWTSWLASLSAAVLSAAPQTAITNSVGIELILIRPGRMQVAVFKPACPTTLPQAVASSNGDRLNPNISWTREDLARCHKLAREGYSSGFPVTLAKAFYIGKFEITQEQWVRVMGSNPSVFRDGFDALRHPVDSISWKQAQSFVKKLNALEHTRSYRLPSEFEWEFAGRAGDPGQIGWNAVRSQAVQGSRATPSSPAPPTTQVVGSKLPNAWGLYDMLGNVWEWVEDFYNDKTFPDPIPPAHGSRHVLKGAGFLSDVKNTIYATHGAGPADGWDVGFRIAKDVE